MSWNNARSSLERSQQGGVPRITQEMFRNPIPLSLSFFCGYPLQIGLPRADPEKSGRTIATPPPETGAPCGPRSGAMFHADPGPPEGRYRPY